MFALCLFRLGFLGFGLTLPAFFADQHASAGPDDAIVPAKQHKAIQWASLC